MSVPLLCFLSTFVAVFTLGLQSLNVNQGHYVAAGVTSIFIGAGHIMLYKYMPTAAWPELLAYFAGGVAGITSSMWFHRRAKAWLAGRAAEWRLWWQPTREARGSVDEHANVRDCGYQPLPGRELNPQPPRAGSGVQPDRPPHDTQ